MHAFRDISRRNGNLKTSFAKDGPFLAKRMAMAVGWSITFPPLLDGEGSDVPIKVWCDTKPHPEDVSKPPADRRMVRLSGYNAYNISCVLLESYQCVRHVIDL
jgi:hypothetical protein